MSGSDHIDAAVTVIHQTWTFEAEEGEDPGVEIARALDTAGLLVGSRNDAEQAEIEQRVITAAIEVWRNAYDSDEHFNACLMLHDPVQALLAARSSLPSPGGET